MSRAESTRGPWRVLVIVLDAGLACAAVAAAWPELRQLWVGVTAEYHSGSPPVVPTAGGALLAVAALLVLLAAQALGRAPPPWASSPLLLGFALAVWPHAEPKERTWAGAGTTTLKISRDLFDAMNGRLQVVSKAPTDAASWQQMLEALTRDGPACPYRARGFGSLPWRVAMVASPDAVPSPLVPGTLLVWVPANGARFRIAPVGLGPEGVPIRLPDEHRKPVVFEAAVEGAAAPP